MKKYFLLLVSFVASSAFAQIEIDKNDLYLFNRDRFITNDSTKSLINFNLGYYLNSNAVTNDFCKGLLYGEFIDNDKKDQVTKRLKDVNRGGYDFNAGLTFQHRLKSDLSVVVGLNQRQQLNAKFSKDVFELTFRGNKQYVGETAQLSPLSINYFDYQSLFLGLQKNINSKFIIGGGVSFIRGGNYKIARIERGTLYTDTDGAFLDFDMKFKLAFSESDNFFSSNGIGAALNFNTSLIRDKGQWNFEVRDLGLIKWNNLNVYEGDDLFRYDGIEVNNILDFSDSIFTEIKADSIAKEFGIQKEIKDLNYLIPATFHLNYIRHFSSKISLVAGVKHMINAGYRPRVYLKGVYYIREGFFVAPMLAYGGFGRMDFELAASKSFNNKWTVSANAFYLEYLVLPKKSSGQGFNLSLTKLF